MGTGAILAGAFAAVNILFYATRPRAGMVLGLCLMAAAFSHPLLYPFGKLDRGNISDISQPALVVTTFTIPIICAFFLWKNARPVRLKFVSTIVVAVAGLVVSSIFVWKPDQEIIGGTFHVIIAIVAFALGQRIGAGVWQTPDLRRLAAIIFLLAIVELSICVFQLLFTTLVVEGRSPGTFSNPTVLGKYAILLLGLLLPLLRSADRATRAFSVLASLALLGATALTVTRANVVMYVAMFVIWELIVASGRRASIASRARNLSVIAMISVPFIPAILDRFRTDPDGGARDQLMAATKPHIIEYIFQGTGPNSFVSHLASSEYEIGVTGFPVHNTFLLLAMEAGIFVSLALLAPSIYLIVWGLRQSVSSAPESAVWARAGGVMSLAILGAGMTGWGFLQDPILGVWLLVTGVLLGLSTRREVGDGESREGGQADGIQQGFAISG